MKTATKTAQKTRTVSGLERIEQHIAAIKGGQFKVKPGQSQRFSEASVLGSTIAQGDLYLMIVGDSVQEAIIPTDYAELKNPTDQDRQLVPGNTEGARHCLDSFDGVVMYRPKVWNGEDLRGPILKITEERTILHRKSNALDQSNNGHGSVIIPAGFTVFCGYQPEYDAEQRAERRNAD